MKKKIIILVALVVGLLTGFVAGKNGTYMKIDSYMGTYNEKTIQDETGPFQLSLDEGKYQYYNPGTKKSGSGTYVAIDTGTLVFTSGDLQSVVALCEKQFMKKITLKLYDSDNQKKIILVKSTDSVSQLAK